MIDNYWDRVLTSRISRRRALAASGATALGSALLVACGGGSDGGIKLDDAGSSREPGTVWFAKNDWKLADESKAAVKGGIYRGVMDADQDGHYDPMTLNPGAVPFSKHVHEFLLTKNRGPGIDPTSSAAGQPRSALAESWEISTDGLSITFTMRQGVKWHPVAPVNGRVMDIEDWRSSQVRHFATGPHRATMLEVIDKAEYPDSRTMVWKMKYPYGPIFERVWSERFSHVIMPKELNADVALAERTSIGTGYKILDRHQPAITMDFRKHIDYWEGEPFIDRWNSPIIPEYANRYAQFISGNIMDFTPTARDVLLLAKDAPNTVIVAGAIPDDNASRMRFGVISPEKWPWADPRVRIAVRRSIDFKSIGEFLSNKQQLEAGGIPIELRPMSHVPQHPGYALNAEAGEMGAASANLLYDPAEAKKLVAAVGYPNGVELPYFVEAVRNEVSEPDQLVMDSLAATGALILKVHRSQSSVEHRQYRSLLNMDGFVAQSSTSEDADYFVYRDYHSLGRVGSEGIERVAFPDPRIDRLAEGQRRELDPAKRFQYLKDFQILAAELMPALPGRHLFTTFSFRWPWLHNAHYGPGGSPPDGRPLAGGHLHWLDAAMTNRDKGAF